MPDTNKKTVELDLNKLPAGTDVANIYKMIERAEKTNNRAKVYNESRRKAQSELAKNHPDEYKKLLAKYNPSKS